MAHPVSVSSRSPVPPRSPPRQSPAPCDTASARAPAPPPARGSSLPLVPLPAPAMRVRAQLDRRRAVRRWQARANPRWSRARSRRPGVAQDAVAHPDRGRPEVLHALAQRRQLQHDARERASRDRGGSARRPTSAARSRSDIAIALTRQRVARLGDPLSPASDRPVPSSAARIRRRLRARPQPGRFPDEQRAPALPRRRRARPCRRRSARPAHRRRRSRRRPSAPAARLGHTSWCSARASPSLPVPGSPSSTKFVRIRPFLQPLDDVQDAVIAGCGDVIRMSAPIQRAAAWCSARSGVSATGRAHGGRASAAPSRAGAARSPALDAEQQSIVAWSAAGKRYFSNSPEVTQRQSATRTASGSTSPTIVAWYSARSTE